MAFAMGYFAQQGFPNKRTYVENLNEFELLSLFRQLHLLTPRQVCINCNVEMGNERKEDVKFNYIFRCNNCGATKACTIDSIFYNRKLDPKLFLEITQLFCLEMNLNKVEKFYEHTVSRDTIESIYELLFEVCTLKLRSMNRYFTFGGPGQSVQVDESCFCKNKNNVGRLLRGQHSWVLGVADEATRKLFLQLVPNRTAPVILPPLRRRIRRGSIVKTDLFAPYMHLAAMGYTHRTVNHSTNFVDPVDGTNTNLIEGFWSVVKRKLRSLFLMGSPHIRRNLDLIMYLLAYKEDRYRNLIEHIAEIYDL